MGFEQYADNSIHYAYEMVALSKETAKRLGMESDDDGDIVAFSGRKGIGVKADDLLNEVEALTYEEVCTRSPEEPEEERRRRAGKIAISAVRFFILQYSRSTVISFDMESATRLDGDSGPYIQYAYVRARHIFEKMGIWGKEWDWLRENRDVLTGSEYLESDEGRDVWQFLYGCIQLDDIILRTLRTHDLNCIAEYILECAKAFHRFYLKYRIIQETDPMKQYAPILATALFLRTLRDGMHILGLPEVEKM